MTSLHSDTFPMDTSGLDAVRQLQRELQRRQVTLILANVTDQPLSLIRRSGFENELGPENIVPSVASLDELDEDAEAARADPARGH